MKNMTAIKIRKSWGILNPMTRILNSKKAYSRKIKHKNQSW